MTFHVIDMMIAHSDVVGVDAEPKDRLVDDAEILEGGVDQAEARAEQPVPQQAGRRGRSPPG